MTNLLLKLFIKGDLTLPKNRSRGGTLAGIVGVSCNLLLFFSKLFVGIISGSVAIIADAFNNLSDIGSSVVTMLGFKIASKPADPEHPFGHGRMEYMSATLVSILIIYVGIQLLTESISKFKIPTVPDSSWVTITILALSILVKLWLSMFSRKIGSKIDSSALKASAADSLNDCISTGAVLAVIVVSIFFKEVSFVKYLDSIAGTIVALFILWSGLKTLKETMDPLIGLAPEQETVKEIKDIVMSEPDFLGIHDMIIHNYGPGRSFVSLHVEVSATCDILVCHEKIDACERTIKEKTGIDAVIHMDPIVTDDETVNFIKEELKIKIAEIDSNMSIHDFRMVKGEKQNNLIFDVCTPISCKLTDTQIKSTIQALATEMNSTYVCVITIDKDFT